MAENTKRSVFGFHGLFGFFISIVGLGTICTGLMLIVMHEQREAVKHPYDPSVIRDLQNLKMISVDNKKYSFKEKAE